MSTTLSITPGKLIKLGESITISTDTPSTLYICKGLAGNFETIKRVDLTEKNETQWTPPEPGMYQLQLATADETLTRPIAVVTSEWAVAQITVGAFTADDFSEVIHPAGVSADYYVALQRPGKTEEYSTNDPRWLQYENFYGDAIHPHIMASHIGTIDPNHAHLNPNWDTLTLDQTVGALEILKKWWHEQGFEPLDRIATYTPCNTLVQACSLSGIRIIHSLCSEQNWSDGEWCINHWGMPNSPFWMTDEDFRKAGTRSANSVLGITMNHYQAIIPHLTKWGDFVLSPSHFDRWIRSLETGDEPIRFEQFARDTIAGWRPLGDNPFFFVAGFEFGRTFGVRRMTHYNRKGLQYLVNLSKNSKLVFATSRDVLAYFDRHIEKLPQTAFHQRDTWAGCTVNGKPPLVGDTIVIEKNDYKAILWEDEPNLFLYYDYTIPWKFGTRDENAPDDFADDCRRQLHITLNETSLTIHAGNPITRPIPFALWDKELLSKPSFHAIPFPPLDDKRHVTLFEIPKGWSGTEKIEFKKLFTIATSFHTGKFWRKKTLGEGDLQHTYLILNTDLLDGIDIPVTLSKNFRFDGATDISGHLEKGTHPFHFATLLNWYRFWGANPEDIHPPSDEETLSLISKALLPKNWEPILADHEKSLQLAALKKWGAQEKDIRYQMLCGANLPTGGRARAKAFDRASFTQHGYTADEHGDGVISFGPGKNFWYHPRGVHIKISSTQGPHHFYALLNSYDPLHLNAELSLHVGKRECGQWKLPNNPFDERAWFAVEIHPGDFNHEGNVSIGIGAKQTPVLENWWKDKGFIANIHALWLFDKKIS